ncbi:hypothetical protein [Clostridium lundense]|uniref:hypothetical protein n=1 Tax=Clostridium lundense TaxID=319475 RepID=UPI00048449F8|nr:hypothetical protein [Clostridium lundense]
MCNHEFGIIDNLQKDKDYGDEYTPEKYHCISVHDDIINLLVGSLKTMKTYFHTMNRPDFGLAYYGITLIPPESLMRFQDIILSSKKFRQSKELVELANLISKAIEQNKYIIHYGI